MMFARTPPFALSTLGLAAGLALSTASTLGWAQNVANSTEAAKASSSTSAHSAQAPATSSSAIQPGERLSTWLLRQTGPATAPSLYPEGLLWTRSAEQPAQRQLRQLLLETGVLTSLIDSLPITGRVALARPDARWLQAHPEQDPVLGPLDALHLPTRPRTVTVVNDDGTLCLVPHTPGALAVDDVAACNGGSASGRPWAWLAQPDGRTTRMGLSRWNDVDQTELAPGAWIWAPSTQLGLAEGWSEAFIKLLATQGVSGGDTPASSSTAFVSGTPARLVAAPSLPPERQATRRAYPSASDWGSVGLLQTPTARMADVGAMRFHYAVVQPYTNINVIFQPFESLEAGFRYTTVSNRIYGISTRDYTDKSFDLKLRLLKEGDSAPQLATGLRDIGGTGLFGGEYLVANKRWGNFDFSLGLGWGYIGARGSLGNPLSVLGQGFKTRPVPDFGQGGTLSTSSYFRGPVAPFGGVQWQSPIDGLSVKLELDGNNYQHEPLADNQKQKTPINLGVVYQYSPGVDWSAGIERGNRINLGLTLHTDLDRLQTPKLADPVLPRFVDNAPASLPASGWAGTAADLERYTGWRITRMAQQGQTLLVDVDQTDGTYRQERIERMAPLLHRDAPANVQHFVLQLSQRGMPLSAHTIDRAAWVESQSQASSPATQPLAFADVRDAADAPTASSLSTSATPVWLRPAEAFTFGLGPSFAQTLGGPDAFVLYQLGVAANAEWRMGDSTWLSGIANLRLIDNYSKFSYTAPSDLPRVRTYQREFVTSSRFTLPNLQLTHAQKVSDDQFVSVYGGLLESMYAGVGAEWLYRPWRSPVALGVDVNHVQQRGFKQDFSLRQYRVNTGHATLYWDTGISGIQTKLSAGQYLAGDRGVTADASRRFGNGVTLGAYATKTNVSAAQFGEGSFDKGLYLSIPFDAMLASSSTEVATLNWQPLARDGGARLARRFTLFDMSSLRDKQAMAFKAPAGTQTLSTGDATAFVPNSLQTPSNMPDVSVSDVGQGLKDTARQLSQATSSPAWWWVGGAVLAASVLDKPVDKFMQRHQGGKAQTLGNAANSLPLLLAAGTGLSITGLFGQDQANTGWTATKAATAALATNTVLRFAIGRARPDQNQGNTSFNGFNKSAASSGLPSNHTAIAFAFVTPFAQQYEMPWLYGVATAAGLGRLQQRKHWFSDVVAGGLVGYTMGSLALDQQHGRKGWNSPRLMLGFNTVGAQWEFE